MPTIRTFLAIEIPEAQKREIRALQEELRSRGGGVRWVRSEGIHLTLKFLGDVEDGQIEGIGAAVSEAAQLVSPLQIRIQGSGAFPNVRSPKVLWVGVVEPSGRLEQLAAAIERLLQPLGFPPEGRKFSPHLTLGRVKEMRGVEEVVEALGRREFDGGEFEAREIVVMKSQLKPTGAEYTPLRRIALG